MRPMFPLSVARQWQRAVTAGGAAVAALFVASLLPASAAPWVGITVAVVLVAVIMLRWRAAPLTELAVGRLRRHGRVSATDDRAVESYQLPWAAPDQPAALRHNRFDIVAVVAVDGVAHSPSVLDQHRVEAASTVPVDAVADALAQIDVDLDGIDIVSVGRRCAARAHHEHAAQYSSRVGEHGAVGTRRTWCVLRINSVTNADAAARRESVAATVAACAARLAAELTARQCPARVVGEDELADIDEALRAEVDGQTLSRWGHLAHTGGVVTGYWLTPDDITTENLVRVWIPETDYTATTVQLRPAPGGGVQIGAFVRYGTGGPLSDPPLTGLNPLSGRHGQALSASRVTAGLPGLRVPYRRLAEGENLRAPAGANGIIVSASAQGHPFLVDLGPTKPGDTAVVTVAAELAYLMQLALRQAAIGYFVLVVTGRPQPWSTIVGPGLQVVTIVPSTLPRDGRSIMAIIDMPAAKVPRADITMRVVAPNSTTGVVGVDVHLEQDSARTVLIRTAQFSHRGPIDLGHERNLIAGAGRGPRRRPAA